MGTRSFGFGHVLQESHERDHIVILVGKIGLSIKSAVFATTTFFFFWLDPTWEMPLWAYDHSTHRNNTSVLTYETPPRPPPPSIHSGSNKGQRGIDFKCLIRIAQLNIQV